MFDPYHIATNTRG